MEIALSRFVKAAGWQDVSVAVNGQPVACAEGERLRLTVRAAAATTVHMGGGDLVPTGLAVIGDGIEATYEFVIDSWAGRTTLDVVAGDVRREVTLDVRPHPGKLGIDAFTDLLMELAARSAALPWGMAPGHHGGQVTGPTAAAVFPVVLDVLLPELLRHLHRFLRDPPIAVRRRRDLAPLSMARRPDTQTVRWLANHPRTMVALRPGDGGTVERLPSLPTVDQPVTVTDHDHPVTRHLLFQLQRVRRSIDDAVRRLEALAGSGHWQTDPYARGQAARIVERCRQHRATLAEALSAPVFRRIRPEPAAEGALQALADLPAAAAVQRLAHRLLSAGLNLNAESEVEAALKRTYDLYEAVVFYRLADAVASALGHGWTPRWLNATANPHEERPHGGVVWHRDGAPGTAVRLLYQQTFAAYSGKAREWHSLTGEFRPDYVIAFEQEGACAGWLILDAKFRASRPAVHDALRDLHVYRDALRRRGRNADGAYIIVPALHSDAEAYAASRYVAEHRFGAVYSGADDGNLVDLVRAFRDGVGGATLTPLAPAHPS
ncbi:nuclease domain-containing protein [Azospirillum sp. ST 5-10]|uniref:nuclease domain-containing protein n=1 Tax=unclassified Azospirillum TaxID=2630922 RepID=UPI003F4A6A6C